VCDDLARQWLPSAAAGVVVWSEGRNDSEDIYAYDLAIQSEFVISDEIGDQALGDTDGRTVVWAERSELVPAYDIYGYDLPTRSTFPICTMGGSQGNPRVSGRYVVWQDARQSSINQDIYAYHLTTGTELPVCTAEESQVGPAIYGNIVVWMDYRNDPEPLTCWPNCNTDIYGYDLGTGQEFAICVRPGLQGYPAVYGDTVLWIDSRNGNYDIYGYDLTTHEESAVVLHPADQLSVSINENWIVWTDQRDEPNPETCGAACNFDIYGLRRGIGTEMALVTGTARQFQPALDGNALYWADNRNEPDPAGCGSECNYDIYGAALLPGEVSVLGANTDGVGLGEPIVLEFALPMEPSSVTYECTPDPGGWTETWDGAARLVASSVLTLTHEWFSPDTSYAFTVTGGVDVLGRAIEPFGLHFHTAAFRVFLPLVVRK
jgi:beta propeller repeat protein